MIARCLTALLLFVGLCACGMVVPKQEPFEDFTIGTPPVVVGERVYLLSRHCRAVTVDRRNGELVFRPTLSSRRIC
jgi:hypothetical protein